MTLLMAWQNLEIGERRARLRALQALAHVLAGRRAGDLVNALRAAETDPAALTICDAALDALPTIPRRRILATFFETLPISAR
jgi:hypothetical protein